MRPQDREPVGEFCELIAPTLRELGDRAERHTYRRGQVIFAAGDSASAVHCVQTGAVKLYRTMESGVEAPLRVAGPGDIVGYRALLADEPCAATAEAVIATSTLAVPSELLWRLLGRSPRLGRWLLRRLALELRYSEDELISQTHDSVMTRTARWLIRLDEHIGVEPRDSVRSSDLSRVELARIVGTTPETMSRTLHELARRGVIEVDRTRIVIHDQVTLRRVAAGELDGGQVMS